MTDSGVQKWNKYLILCELGLSSILLLEKSIHRFAVTEYRAAAAQARRLLKGGGVKRLVVIKMVNPMLPGQLHNIRLQGTVSLLAIEDRIRTATNPHITEIWVCASQVSRDMSCFSGRLRIDLELGEEYLEIIWWASPRLLESRGSRTRSLPYLALQRQPGRIQFSYESIEFPLRFSVAEKEEYCEYALEKIGALRVEHRTGIERLLAECEFLNIQSVSIEFKFERGVGQFIDWDTAYDRVIIERFLHGD